MLELIRSLGRQEMSHFLAHVTQPALHALARCFFGSWAVAGLDRHLTIQRARQRFLRA